MNMLKRQKRYFWLINMIELHNYKIGAEIGCQNANTTSMLLQYCSDLKLYAVDLWGPVPDEIGGGLNYKNWDFKTVKKEFDQKTAPYKNRMTVLQGLSWEMADKVKDNSLDFIFIDASHEYEPVKKDILAWTPKLKAGGLLSGHDCNLEGVKQAIDELIPTWKDSGVNDVWFAKKEDLVLI